MQRMKHPRRVLATTVAFALTSAVGVGASLTAQAADVTRLGGSDRIATGIKVYESNKDVFTGKTAVIAGTNGFADALAASPLAAAHRGPLLSTQAADIDTRVVASLKKQGITRVVVMGQKGAVSADAAATLQAAGIKVERIGGADRYETALLAARATMDARGTTKVPVFVADGSGFGDALSAGSAAVKEGGVVVLSRDGSLDPAVKTFLTRNASSVVAIGGGAVKAVRAAGVDAERIAGSDRYGTAAQVAVRFFPSASSVVLASGADYGDAVSGSPLAALTGAPLLLTRPTSLPAQTASYLAANKPDITLLGGTGVVSTGVSTTADAVADTGSVDGVAPTPTPSPSTSGPSTPKPTGTPTSGPIGPSGPGNQTGTPYASGTATINVNDGPMDLQSLNVTNPRGVAEQITAVAVNGGPTVSVKRVETNGIVYFYPRVEAKATPAGVFTYDLMNGTQKIGTFTLNVEAAPSTPAITGGGAVALNGRMMLTASATGGNLTYEWLKSASETGTYSVVATTKEATYAKTFTDADAGFYKVRVRNSKGEATSTSAVQVFKAQAAVKVSKLTFDAISAPKVGVAKTITGKLTEKDGLTAVADAPVVVTMGGKSVTATTNSSGVFSATITPATAGANQTASASFVGDATHTGTSGTSATFTIDRAVPSLTIAADPASVEANKPLSLTGTATGLGGTGTVTFYDITVQGATATGGGTQVGTGTIAADGSITGKATFTSTGTRKLVARFAATSNSEAAASNVLDITVS